jgi:carbamoyltransferase
MSNYVLGTGLSHDGSTCLLKDGKIIVAIEKERLSRRKHDGGNDFLTVEYCLKAAGIQANDLSLIVQAANFEIDIKPDRHHGKRFFDSGIEVPIVTISHHLAHAWSAVGSSPFDQCNVMVIDGAGSPYQQCLDLQFATIPTYPFDKGMYCEKDSFYFFDGKKLNPVFKDFSEIRLYENKHSLRLPTNYHSIGGLYSAASFYCFGDMDDTGKLMGLAPYGELDGKPDLFRLKDGIVEVQYEHLKEFFTTPSEGPEYFSENFRHYANIARWVQAEAEKAILYLFESRTKLSQHTNMAYAGGVALNAVVNNKLLSSGIIENLYMQPAAGDNGIAIGCAWYGWHEVLEKLKQKGAAIPFLGKSYSGFEITEAIKQYEETFGTTVNYRQTDDYISQSAELLANGKVIGWYQEGAEFGPRALGHRSILADPRKKEIRDHINKKIKFREDFRPFAPAVRLENANTYFKRGHESPYMILVDHIRPEWEDVLTGVIHQDKSCRVQTVTQEWNRVFYNLLGSFEEKTGIGVLLNTSLNKKGMPIVETPLEALQLFYSGAMDALILNNYIIEK